jgi:subtilisin family serine protease
MTAAILLLFCAWPRPACPPVTAVDVELARRLEVEFSRVVPTSPMLGKDDRVPGRFTVGFVPGYGESLVNWLHSAGAEVAGVRSGFIVATAATGDEATDRLMAKAAGQPGVRYVEPSYYVRACYLPNDPEFLRRQWDKWVMYADEAWDITTGSAGVRVAIADNGADYTHPDLAAGFVTGDLGYDFVSNDADPRPDDPSNPQAFHGTHVAGIIGAGINDGRGIAGWSRSQLLAVRVLNDSGSGFTDDLAEGIRWAVDHNCKVVNMSLTASSAPTAVVDACNYAVNNNVLLVAASGNEGSGSIGYPANLSTVVAVGSLGQDSRIATYSNFGPAQEVIAPGSVVYSTAPNGNYAIASGTSMAAPQVTGVAALMYAANAGLTAARARALLAAGAIDMGTPGRDIYHGYGLLNARRAAELARGGFQAASLTAGQTPGHALLVRGAFCLDGEESAVVYDATGRMAVSLLPGETVLLAPGAWFLRSAAGTRRLVVLR